MFKPSCSYCYVSWTRFLFCSRLSSYLRMPPRDLPGGSIVRSGREVRGAVGTSSALRLHPWTRAESWKARKIFGKSTLSPGDSRDTDCCHVLGPGLCLPRALFNTIQHLQGEGKVSGSDNRTPGTAANPTPQHALQLNQPMPESAAPLFKKQQ